MQRKKVYNGVTYIRLSKDDGDKLESNSVTNQRALLQSFLENNTDIKLITEKVDDGYSGINFDRPAFKEMMDLVKKGEVDCIIVKDLSRFGRDYLETGRYIEKVFPLLSVRFIAINDNYDSLNNTSNTDSIIIPFKNLINDSYSRDISTKVRSSINIRQKKGEYIGAFALYGYVKSEEDNKKLEIDEFAADVIRDIYKMRIEGYSTGKIADILNENGVLSPYEYKQLLGYSYKNPFKVNEKAKWCATTIERILKNEMYTGVMVQNRSGRINYKLDKKISKAEDEWIRVEGTHEAIISKENFNLIQEIAKLDTRTKEGNDFVYPFSGVLYCDTCDNTMVRKIVRSKGKEYVYYICSTYKADKHSCTNHRISDKSLRKTVLKVINKQINIMVKLYDLIEYIEKLPLLDTKYKKVDRRILSKMEELDKYNNLRAGLYEDYKAGIISKSDYMQMKSNFETRCNDIEKNLKELEIRAKQLIKNKGKSNWIINFTQNRNITEITRPIIVSLIKKIIIVDKNKIIIHFRYRDEFKDALNYVENILKQTQSNTDIDKKLDEIKGGDLNGTY
ncbi:recombinase family protein [Clostridiaceae bacterium M8S5]|nr:recombinase family protein [Clostridiaceae bacterium M8S5]